MELSQVLSWIGSATGMFILILITCSCLLVRAIAIKELAFIFHYTFLILINSLQLFLIWKYKDRDITA